MLGHAPSGVNADLLYEVYDVVNFASPSAAQTELETLLGGDCELVDMVVAGINANVVTNQFCPISIIPLKSTDTDFGNGTNAAFAALNQSLEVEFLVSCYDGMSNTLTRALIAQAALMSGPQRVSNQQFGTMAVAFNRSTLSPGSLTKYDSQYFVGVWMPDSTTSGANAPAYTVGQSAAAAACAMAGNLAPFNPLDGVVINALNPPYLSSDYVSVGYGLESETALLAGWTPLQVTQDDTVAFVRTITARLTLNGEGSTVTSYYDVQDFQVLYYWRKTLYTRFSQPDFSQIKASVNTAQNLLAEMIRLAKVFEDQTMFEAVDQLAKQFVVQRDSVDRSRFDVLTPVNVVPGLHIIATNVVATTEYDSISI